MNFDAIMALLTGIAIIIFPKHIRKYKLFELGITPSRNFIIIQRVGGFVLVISSLAVLLLDL
jgi:hypothetical protein